MMIICPDTVHHVTWIVTYKTWGFDRQQSDVPAQRFLWLSMGAIHSINGLFFITDLQLITGIVGHSSISVHDWVKTYTFW